MANIKAIADTKLPDRTKPALSSAPAPLGALTGAFGPGGGLVIGLALIVSLGAVLIGIVDGLADSGRLGGIVGLLGGVASFRDRFYKGRPIAAGTSYSSGSRIQLIMMS